ncbi:hypothetical protein [Adlercreutzia muris]|uniref:hypothetical protein n=1 Tax=Adlercreutzia muris TaxID=1796610 RepID=UPI001F218F80|nr:hypothetical protein [Adlercreutzia muris]
MAVVRPQPWGEGADVTFYCDDEPDDAWEGFKEPKAKALDQFILMRTIPACVPGLPERVLKRDYKPWSGDLEVLRIRLSARHR